MAYSSLPPPASVDTPPPLKGFKAFALDTTRNPVPSYSRLDFYKVSLVTGHIVVQYADHSLELTGTHLLFANPTIPYSTLLLSAKVTGCTCLFTAEFVRANGWFDSLQRFPLFPHNLLSVSQLPDAQAEYSTGIFQKMLAAQNSDYQFKGELVCSYLHLVLHEGLRIQRQENLVLPYQSADGNPSLLLG